MQLSFEQEAAVEAPSKVCIAACAGSGKTTVLVARIVRQIGLGVDPAHMVAITFTRRAAENLRKRLAEAGVEIGYIGTVHAWALSQLNLVLTEPLRAAPANLFERMVAEERRFADVALDSPLMPAVFKKVRSRLELNGLVDFDGILELAAERAVDNPAWLQGLHLFVDEYQDTGPLEQQLYHAINPTGLTIVGDEKQCLYSFRGADPESMNRTAERFNMTRVSLTRNYRCAGWINDYALMENCHREPREMDIHQLVDFIINLDATTSELTILCGYNDTVDRLSKELRQFGVQVSNQPSILQRQQLEAYIRFRATQAADQPSEMLLLNALNLVDEREAVRVRAQSTAALTDILEEFNEFDMQRVFRLQSEQLDQLQELMPELSLEQLADAVSQSAWKEQPGVQVMTVHAAKGLEWDTVVFVDELRGTAAHERMRYVAITRAKSNIYHVRLHDDRRY